MSSIFRSEVMGFYNIVMPRESAWDILNELGTMDSVHFIDSDPYCSLINRPFGKYVKRCDEVLVKIQNIVDEITKFEKVVTPCED